MPDPKRLFAMERGNDVFQRRLITPWSGSQSRLGILQRVLRWDIPYWDAGSRVLRSPHAPAYRKLRSALAAARVEEGLTQADVAKKLKKPQSFVSKYESPRAG